MALNPTALSDPALAVTLKEPLAALTVKAGAVATPFALVTAKAVAAPLNVPLAPAGPTLAVNVTSAPGRANPC